jgi:glycopeptide antibiotics resistance protein
MGFAFLNLLPSYYHSAVQQRTLGKNQEIAGVILALVGLGAILGLTLWPFTFRWHSLGLSEYLFRFEHIPSGMLDFPENIILFMPFGVGLALAIEHRIQSRTCRILFIVVLGGAVSLCVESLQIFLSERIPNLSDILSNSLGALAGAGTLRLWHIRQNLPGAISVRIIRWDIRIIFGSYLFLLLVVTWLLMTGLRPAFWDSSYRLALGNASAT